MCKSCRAHRDEHADAERCRHRLPVATKTVEVYGTHRFSPSSSVRGMAEVLATPITSHEVVDATMNGEGDVSHHLSEYFGSCRSGVGPGALANVLPEIRKGYSLPVFGVACSGSTGAIRAPLVRLVSRGGGLQLGACGVGERAWEENWEKSMAQARHHGLASDRPCRSAARR